MKIQTRDGGIKHRGLFLDPNAQYEVPDDLARYFIDQGWAFDPEDPEAAPEPVDEAVAVEVHSSKHKMTSD